MLLFKIIKIAFAYLGAIILLAYVSLTILFVFSAQIISKIENKPFSVASYLRDWILGNPFEIVVTLSMLLVFFTFKALFKVLSSSKLFKI